MARALVGTLRLNRYGHHSPRSLLTRQTLICKQAGSTGVLIAAALASTLVAQSSPDSITPLPFMEVYGSAVLEADASAQNVHIDGEDIRTSMRSTPLEELSQRSAGIYVSSNGSGLHGVAAGASGGIQMRGLGGSPNAQVLVVEDGVPDYQGIFGHPLADAFIPTLMQRVEVVKGGDGVLYGTNAMGGAIVIHNRSALGSQPRFSSHSAYGSFNTFRQSATLHHQNSRFGATLAATAFSTDGHRSGAHSTSGAVQLRLATMLPMGLLLGLNNKLVQLQGSDPGDVRYGYPPPHPDHWFSVLRNTSSLRLEGCVGDLGIEAVSWLNAGRHALYDGFIATDYTGGAKLEIALNAQQWYEIRAGVQLNGVDGTVDNPIRDSLAKNPLTSSATNSSASSISSSGDGALFAQLTLHPLTGVELVGGGRALYSHPYGTVLLYKAGATVQLLDTLVLRARLSRTFRQPTLKELYLPFPVANPQLTPEYALTLDGGAQLRLHGVVVEVTLFHTQARSLIRYFGSWPQVEVVNIDQSLVQGIETQASVGSAGPLWLEASWCYQDVGHYTRQNPHTKANANAGMTLTLGEWKSQMRLGAEWVDGLYMTNYGYDALSAVFSVDGSLHASTTLDNGVRVEPFALIRNLLNRRIEYTRGYPLAGRTLSCGITLHL
jgi:outer membrane cobalamin receptor